MLYVISKTFIVNTDQNGVFNVMAKKCLVHTDCNKQFIINKINKLTIDHVSGFNDKDFCKSVISKEMLVRQSKILYVESYETREKSASLLIIHEYQETKAVETSNMIEEL